MPAGSRTTRLSVIGRSFLGLLLLAGCERADVPTHPAAAGSGVAGSEGGGLDGTALGLPPGIEDLPIEDRMKAELVGFPDPGAVGICYTQVAARERPIPFRVHRLEVDIPEEAWEEADGETALLQYRRFAGQARYLTRMARCRIPASAIAVDHLLDRFSIAGAREGPAQGLLGAESGTDEWEVMPRSEPSSGIVRWGDAPASSSSDECPEGGDGSEDCPYELDEIEPTVCENEEQTYDEETDECYCENGSDEPDCYLEEGEPTDPEDDDPDCDFEPCGGSDPDDPDGCDPEEEICDLCGDERDVMIDEYDTFSVNLSPDCDDFANSGGTDNFSWTELNGRGPASNAPYGNLHWEEGKWGIVRASLTTGLEATRAHYGHALAITGGYRCPHGNDGISGADPNSAHMHGTAADFRSELAEWDWEECLDLRESAQNSVPLALSQCSGYGGDATTEQVGSHLHAQW